MSDSGNREGKDRARGDDAGRSTSRYSWLDWQADGFRGLPPWRRGYRPLYLAISLALVALLLVVFLIAASRLP